MLTKRGYILIVGLFAVLTAMFMLVNISSNVAMTQNASTRPTALTFAQTSSDSTPAPLPADTVSTSSPMDQDILAPNQYHAAILLADENSSMGNLLKEWCTYNQCDYIIISDFHDAAQIDGCNLLLLGDWDSRWIDALLAATYSKRQIMLLSMPDSQEIAENPQLANLLGISDVVSDYCALDSVHFFQNFFLGVERIYDVRSEADDYFASHYKLRSGYLVFANGIPTDSSLEYLDYPPLLWRTRTNQADVFVNNTDLFSGKSILGLITAFSTQSSACYLYPIINARSVAIVNFPCLSSENAQELQSLYSADSNALTRDQFWPGIELVARSYSAAPTFFVAPRLNYSSAALETTDLVAYYYGQIVKLGGAMELSLLPENEQVSLQDVCTQVEEFSQAQMGNYQFSACFVSPDRIDELLQCVSDMLSQTSLWLTTASSSTPLFSFPDAHHLLISCTDNGVQHDDLMMISLLTALGVTVQQVDMADVYYPSSHSANWIQFSRDWAKNRSYLNDFEYIEDASIYTLEKKVRAYLAQDYAVSQEGDCLILDISSSAERNSFVLSLPQKKIVSAVNAEVQQLSERQYLIDTSSTHVELYFSELYDVPQPSWKEDVKQ